MYYCSTVRYNLKHKILLWNIIRNTAIPYLHVFLTHLKSLIELIMHWTLFRKIIDSKIPLIIVRIISFELHTIICIVKYLVSSDEAVPAKCLCWIIFLILKHLWESQSLALLHACQILKNAIICTIQRSWVIRDLIWKVWTDNLYI